MPRFCPSNWTSTRLIGTALALLTVVLCAPDQARAGCSHGTAELPGIHDPLAFLRQTQALGAIVDPDEDAEARSPRKGSPGRCHGPSCSGRSGLPIVPASVVSPRFSQWAAVHPPLQPAALARDTLRADDRVVWSNPLADPIFHPPRVACPAS
ncbi:hypothetical protein [Aquisphaera insulae]|uniref:hypothetical protein n=1 Tax=Aquisphaera insulae TaxID=2712864 RepID=UPI0013EB9BA2|nr:hypothetical protein [Aquisphaera insulae]